MITMIIYMCPNAYFMSRMSSSGSHKSSMCGGSHCVLSSPMSKSTDPPSMLIQGIIALITGNMSPTCLNLATVKNVVHSVSANYLQISIRVQ